MERIWRRDLHNAAGRQAASSRMHGMEKKHMKWLRKQKKEKEIRQKKSENMNPENTRNGGSDEPDDAARSAGNAYGFDIVFGTGTQVSRNFFILCRSLQILLHRKGVIHFINSLTTSSTNCSLECVSNPLL